jgi:hypothetical protein
VDSFGPLFVAVLAIVVWYVFFRYKGSRSSVRRDEVADGRDIRFRCAVKGESHYQANIRRVAVPGKPVHLVPEPTNPYDRNAVRVDCDGLCIGYIPREQAREAKDDEWKAIIAAVNSGDLATGIVLGITQTYRDQPTTGDRSVIAPETGAAARKTRRRAAGVSRKP